MTRKIHATRRRTSISTNDYHNRSNWWHRKCHGLLNLHKRRNNNDASNTHSKKL